MRALIQRVKQARVVVDDAEVSAIGPVTLMLDTRQDESN